MDVRAAQGAFDPMAEAMHTDRYTDFQEGMQLISLIRATLDSLELELLHARRRSEAWAILHKQVRELKQQRDFFLEVMNSLGQGVAVTDAEGRFVYINPAYAHMLGYRAEELIGRSPAEAMLQEHAALFSQAFTRGSPGESNTYETYLRCADGNQIYALLTSVSRWRDRTMVGNVMLVTDLTERKRKEDEREELIAQLEQLAAIDELTGIYNRRYFFAVGDRELKRARRYRRPLSVIMLDIDHFKRVNDTYGHAAGDRVLRAVAECCRKGIREIDILGRYGGEEFGILVQEADVSSAKAIAERLRECVISSPVAVDHRSVAVTVSLGVAQMSDDVDDLAMLISRADAALYRAKQLGRNRVVVR